MTYLHVCCANLDQLILHLSFPLLLCHCLQQHISIHEMGSSLYYFTISIYLVVTCHSRLMSPVTEAPTKSIFDHACQFGQNLAPKLTFCFADSNFCSPCLIAASGHSNFWPQSPINSPNQIGILQKICLCHGHQRCILKCWIHQICHSHKVILNRSKWYSTIASTISPHSTWLTHCCHCTAIGLILRLTSQWREHSFCPCMHIIWSQ